MPDATLPGGPGAQGAEDDQPFDANAFEHAQEKEKLAALKDDLGSAVAMTEIKEGQGETLITKLDVVSSRWRQMAVHVLKQLDEESYAEYRKLKYGEAGEVTDPDIAQRKKAYRFAVTRFLDLSYTEIEPDAPSQLQVAGEMWRQQAVQLLKIVDPEAYAEYRKMKYGAGKSPDLDVRKAAYKFALLRFLDASYKIAGF